MWVDVGTSTEIAGSLGQFGRNRVGSMIIPTSTADRVLISCVGGGTYRAGLAQWGNFPSLPGITLEPDDCVDLAYAIDTTNAEAGDTYRLRLVDIDGNALQSYDQYPTLTIQSNPVLRASKEARGSVATTTLDSTNDTGYYTSLALTPDGLPVVSYQDTTLDDLKLARCLTTDCSSVETTTLDSTNNTGYYTSLALTPDGLPAVSYRNDTLGDLKLARCLTVDCSSVATTTLDSTNDTGRHTSLALTPDGLPVVSYRDLTLSDLKLARCLTPDCSSVDITTLDSTNNTGYYTSLALTPDGLPVVSYYDLTLGDLKLARCLTPDCSSVDISTLDSTNNTGYDTSLALTPDGLPVVSYYDTTLSALKLARCLTPDCSSVDITTLDSTNNTGFYTSLALTPDGLPVVSYRNATLGDLKLARCLTPDCSSVETTTLDSTNNTGYYTSLALTPDGLPVVSYQDSIFADLKLARCLSTECDTTGAGVSSDTDDLSLPLDATGYTAIAASDDVYDTLSAASSSLIYNVRWQTLASPFSVSFEVQVEEASETRVEVYRFGSTNAWETVAATSAPQVGSDFTLTGSVSTSSTFREYFSDGQLYTRLTHGTTSGYSTLSVDAVTIETGGVTQAAYQFRNDEGALAVSGSSTAMAATNTALTDVHIGQRMNVFFNRL